MTRQSAYGWMLVSFIIGTLVGGIGGVFLFLRLIGGSGEASTPITAPQLTTSTGQRLFRIDPKTSEARFIVDERDPFIIGLVGSTNEVAGDILVNFDLPAKSEVGVIRVNLRTLRTDDPDRDRSIRGAILLSSQPEYEFAEFTPLYFNGLTGDPVTVGDSLSFQIVGELPLRGITQRVTFDTTVKIISETEISGLARTTIQRADYAMLEGGLIEHGVAEAVVLELEFAARSAEDV